jgi:hypothetical protein
MVQSADGQRQMLVREKGNEKYEYQQPIVGLRKLMEQAREDGCGSESEKDNST